MCKRRDERSLDEPTLLSCASTNGQVPEKVTVMSHVRSTYKMGMVEWERKPCSGRDVTWVCTGRYGYFGVIGLGGER